jgi:hypothetical protein
MPNGSATRALGDVQAELHERVARNEQDIGSLRETVTQLAATVADGFASTRQMIAESMSGVQREVREMHRSQAAATKPNYNAIGVAFAIVGTLLLWFVDSKVGPLAEMIKAEADARRAADTRHDVQRTEDADRTAAVTGKLFDKANVAAVDIAKLQTWEEARKLWVDGKAKGAP